MRLDEISALEVVLTAACNLRCSYCYQTEKKARSMEWSTLRAGLDRLMSSKARDVSVLFIGGEPLLEFGLIQRAVRYLETLRQADRHIRKTVITNGTLLQDEHLAFFATHDFRLQLSFDGIEAAQDIRAPGTFKRLDALVDALRKTHADYFTRRVRVSITLTQRTIECLPASVEYFCDKQVSDIRISPDFATSFDWRPESIADLDRAFARVFETIVRHYNRTGHIPLVLWRHGSSNSKLTVTGPICSVGAASKLTVDVDGNTSACISLAPSYQTYPTTFLKDRAEALQFGPVASANLTQAFSIASTAARATGLFHNKAEKFSSYRRCAECEYVSRCSYCPVSIGHQPGNDDPNRVPDFVCAFNIVVNKYRDLFPKTSQLAEAMRGLVAAPVVSESLVTLLAAAGFS